MLVKWTPEVAAAAVEAVDLLPFCDYNISLKSSNDVTDTFSNDLTERDPNDCCVCTFVRVHI